MERARVLSGCSLVGPHRGLTKFEAFPPKAIPPKKIRTERSELHPCISADSSVLVSPHPLPPGRSRASARSDRPICPGSGSVDV
jgi:hypothetical protein